MNTVPSRPECGWTADCLRFATTEVWLTATAARPWLCCDEHALDATTVYRTATSRPLAAR